MLAQERGCVLAALSEPLVPVAEIRTRLLDELALEPNVEDAAFPGDPVPVDDVELGLAEGRRDLVLDHLHAHAVAHRLGAVLERLDAADVQALGSVELQRAAAGLSLWATKHYSDLFPDLVGEDAQRARAVEVARELAHRLGHHARLRAHR